MNAYLTAVLIKPPPFHRYLAGPQAINI